MAEVHGEPRRVVMDKEESSLEIAEPILIKAMVNLKVVKQTTVTNGGGGGDEEEAQPLRRGVTPPSGQKKVLRLLAWSALLQNPKDKGKSVSPC